MNVVVAAAVAVKGIERGSQVVRNEGLFGKTGNVTLSRWVSVCVMEPFVKD